MARHAAKHMALYRDRGTHDLDAPVEIYRHPAARRMTLKVSPTRRAVIVTVPSGVRLDEASRFLTRHIDWVRAQLDQVPDARPFEDGGMLPLRGAMHLIRFDDRPTRNGLNRSAGVVCVEPRTTGHSILRIHGHEEHAPRRLREWLIAQARKDLSARVKVHADRLGLRPKAIAVRDPVSRWGSCSSTGQLSFSWRLVLAPRAVLDYVAAHEVAHLAEMNHSHRFWALVRRTYPDLDGAKDWLNQHGRELHAYGQNG